MIDQQLAEALLESMRSRRLTLATAESCTGGNIARTLTEIAGASDVFLGSVIAYSNQVKSHILHVSESTLAQYGAVSEPTVLEMLAGILDAVGADCAMATSGIAGPGGGTPDKPVGTVCIGAAVGSERKVATFHFSGSRVQIIRQATYEAMSMLRPLIK